MKANSYIQGADQLHLGVRRLTVVLLRRDHLQRTQGLAFADQLRDAVHSSGAFLWLGVTLTRSITPETSSHFKFQLGSGHSLLYPEV